MILVIDNYDSFTWNLVHYLMELGAEVDVVRNDAISAGQAMSSGAQAFLISPGPKTPNEAGVSLDLVAACADTGKPLLGVCLGHQAIGQYFGGKRETGRAGQARRIVEGLLAPQVQEYPMEYPVTTELPFDSPQYIACLAAFYDGWTERLAVLALPGAAGAGAGAAATAAASRRLRSSGVSKVSTSGRTCATCA